jgi:glycosyltransferase involved in cell wall biosynthesis
MTHIWKWLTDKHIELVIVNEQHTVEIIKKIADLGYMIGAYVDYYTERTIADFNVYDFLLCNTKRHYSVFKNHRRPIFVQWGTDVNLYKPCAFYPARTSSRTVIFFHSAGWSGPNVRKGTDLLVKSFQQVRGDTRLIIHAQVSPERLGGIAETIHKDSRIEFIEKTIPAPGLYHRGDVFVYPTRLEGIGLCVPEALACGLPVITTDNAPMNEFVEDGHNGRLVRVERFQKRQDGYYWPEAYVDIGDLAAKMQFYVDNPQIIAEHQQNARKSAEEKFDWSKNINAFSSDLIEIVKLKTVRRPTIVEQLTWYGKDCFWYGQRFILRLGKVLLPPKVAHFINTPLRWKWKRDLQKI